FFTRRDLSRLELSPHFPVEPVRPPSGYSRWAWHLLLVTCCKIKGEGPLELARTNGEKLCGRLPLRAARARNEMAATHCDAVRCGQWTGPGLNRRHQDFQSCALPTELPVRFFRRLSTPSPRKFGEQGRLQLQQVLAGPERGFKADKARF